MATFTDVGPVDTHTATIDWGDGSEVEAGTLAEVSNSGSVEGTHTYADNGSYIVTVTVADGDSAESSNSLTVTVDNVSPTVTASSDQTVGGVFLYLPEGATFTDPGTDDTHTFTIDWGDGTIEDKTSLAGDHQYDTAGTFVVTFTVTDDDGGSGSGQPAARGNVSTRIREYPGSDSVGSRRLVCASLGFRRGHVQAEADGRQPRCLAGCAAYCAIQPPSITSSLPVT